MRRSATRAEVRTARESAHEILLRVDRDRAFASILLDRVESRLADARESGLVHELVLGVLRRRSWLDHVVGRLARRAVESLDADVRGALRIGAYSLLFLDRVPDFAAVSTAVDLVRSSRPRAAGLVNAVLRRLARERTAWLPGVTVPGDVAGLGLRLGYPRWWVERLVVRLGWDGTVRLLEASNRPAAPVLRPAVARAGSHELALRLAEAGIVTEPCRFVAEALRVRSGRLRDCTALRDGTARVQDEASQLVASMLGPRVGPRVLDLCAAPGGKTLQLAERLVDAGLLVAADRHAGRLRRLRHAGAGQATRGVVLLVADMEWPHAPLRGAFDHLLLDAPCSGTGTLRRHPEIRWRLRADQLKLFAARQRALLETAAALGAPGARVVYSVCSLEPEEGPAVVSAFLEGHPEYTLGDPRPDLPAPARELVAEDRFLRTSPADHELDGFFAALLVRRHGTR